MSNVCPCCQRPMSNYEQASMNPARPSYELAECRNVECSLAFVTLTRGEHERLTAVQIAGYAKVNARFAALAGVQA